MNILEGMDNETLEQRAWLDARLRHLDARGLAFAASELVKDPTIRDLAAAGSFEELDAWPSFVVGTSREDVDAYAITPRGRVVRYETMWEAIIHGQIQLAHVDPSDDGAVHRAIKRALYAALKDTPKAAARREQDAAAYRRAAAAKREARQADHAAAA